MALIAPDGTPTEITGIFQALNGAILSVASADKLLDEFIPGAIGSFLGVMNTHLAANYALEGRLKKDVLKQSPRKTKEMQLSFLADAGKLSNGRPGKEKTTVDEPYAVWFVPFGDFVHQASQGDNPSYNNQMVGALAAFDYSYSNFIFGGGLGYVYNFVEYGSGLGHGNVQEEMAMIYGTYNEDRYWLNAALWAGIFQLQNKRHPLLNVTSTGNTNGWIFSPHIEAGVPFSYKNEQKIILEPFFMFDFVNSWQAGFTEKGSSGLNLVIQSLYTSLLRSEVGTRFYETLDTKWGNIIFQEKFSYVNMTPFHFNPMAATFVGSAASFPIAIGSTQVQNLGSFELNITYLPENSIYPYLSLAAEGEWGAYYQSYFIGLEIGKNF
ncbi:MAG: autotransporter outer membrane beta-barrel domain-containing protein [Chlamydiia bacterium]